MEDEDSTCLIAIGFSVDVVDHQNRELLGLFLELIDLLSPILFCQYLPTFLILHLQDASLDLPVIISYL